jgi:hypothetical protein
MSRVATYVYKLRKVTTNHPTARGRATFALTVPTDVAEKVAEGTLFSLEVTDEGLLYRPLAPRAERKPAWLEDAER